jgi:hypothetical protein
VPGACYLAAFIVPVSRDLYSGAATLLRVWRLFVLCLIATVAVAACDSGPQASPITESDLVCSDDFCVNYPVGWEFEVGDGFIAFTHPDAPGGAFATLGFLNMEAVVDNAGGTWPTTTDQVVRSFWQLLEDGGVATFGALERLTGGSFRSVGAYEDGRMWHLLIPHDATTAISFEVRGPNTSWEAHADAFFAGLEVPG